MKRKKDKKLLLVVSLCIVLGVSLGGTLAFLFARTTTVKNTFIPGKVTTTVEEEFKDNVKTDVKIKNTGNVDAYIRAAVVVTWQDKDGNVYGTTPTSEDYEIEYNLTNGWKKSSDGFYYYTEPVVADGSTDILITSCECKENAPEGYYLNVEIIGSGIQADGITSEGIPVVVEEWASGVSDVNGTTLQIKE